MESTESVGSNGGFRKKKLKSDTYLLSEPDKKIATMLTFPCLIYKTQSMRHLALLNIRTEDR